MNVFNYDPLISDHNTQILEFKYNVVPILDKYPKIRLRKINDTNISHLNVKLSKENWENVTMNNETDKAYTVKKIVVN